jgi:kumamolisin
MNQGEIRMTTFRLFRSLAVLCLALSANAATPGAIDRGALDPRAAITPISITIALALPGLSDAEKLQQSLYTPGDPQFHQFLTADQFVARFAPTDADVAKVVAAFAKYGLTAEKTTATTLKVTGLPADFERTFSVSLHAYEVPAHDNVAGYTYHAATNHATVPAEISAWVAAVAGLDNSPSFHPRYKAAPPVINATEIGAPSGSTGGPIKDPFEYLTVADFASYYDVDPLYKQGVTGAGRTIGIMTFAAFTPSDAFAYWKALGLKVNSNRIQIVNIDGGPGAPSDESGSLETTIDVEQSGGIAPGANIIVYQAPNTDQGFVDLFAKAIDANAADSLSISWGEWEWFDNLENSPVTDPTTGRTVGTTQAVHELLLRASIQGEAAYAASADGGAYDANNDLGCEGPYSPSQPYSCSLTLSVDYPASDTYMTAAGGTTLPGLQEYCITAACTGSGLLKIDVPHERVWGWDYLEPLCEAEGVPNPIDCGIFSAGSGGGVSVAFGLPQYQFGIFGTQVSQPGQFFEAGSGFAGEGFGLQYALPAFYPGRNVPDVSFNADPQTGYVVYYTSSSSGFGVEPGWGGTSFVGPQLNGVSALLGQYLNKRLGFLNPSIYGLAQSGQAYFGFNPAVHAIAYGDNWFYHGSNGYNPAAGLGTLDVFNFAQALHGQF